VRDEQGELIGYFSFGTSCLVWDSDEPGLRPDLTGRGPGLAFVQASLDFARQAFAPASFVLYVYTWNERAIRVYERASFRRVRVFTQSSKNGESEWLEMAKEA
jgi:ribosomal-protein-alanine N-acetyltransferase